MTETGPSTALTAHGGTKLKQTSKDKGRDKSKGFNAGENRGDSNWHG